MPVPAQFRGVLQGLLGVDVETHVGASCVAGRVGEHDAGSEVPDDALAGGLEGFEVAFDVCPVPGGFLLVVVLVASLLHIKYDDVIRLHILKSIPTPPTLPCES